jgi:hypothetical protein
LSDQLDAALQFLESAVRLAETKVGQAEAIVSIRKTPIHLDGIAVLDGRLAVLALLEVALSALEILLLANVGIARASGEPDEDNSQN